MIVSREIHIESDTGDVTFDMSDAEKIFVKTGTGDVRGTLLTGKSFSVKTDTGKIDIPKDSIGGKCEITTDTGNIKISVP